MSLRVIVTGSRTWTDADTITSALDTVAKACDYQLTVVHGDSPKGADSLAGMWAWLNGSRGVREEKHPADWRTFGKRAGFIRNQHMIHSGADLVLAFIAPCQKPDCPDSLLHGSHGASSTVDLATVAEIPVRSWFA